MELSQNSVRIFMASVKDEKKIPTIENNCMFFISSHKFQI
jgi:hypothetical protein